MKTIKCVFEFGEKNEKTGEIEYKTYSREIEFPERAPIAFHALNQWGYEVFHREKLALKKRVEQLERMLEVTVLTMNGATHTSSATLSDTIATVQGVLDGRTEIRTED